LDLRSQILFLRHWAWLLAVAVVAGGALTYLVMQTQPKVYQATATLIVGPSLTAEDPGYNGLLASQLLAQTYARVATTGPLLERVIQLEGLSTTTADLGRRVFAIAPLDSTLITITVQDILPDRAARVANAVADDVVRVPATIHGGQPAAQDFIDREVAATQGEILDVLAAIQRLGGLSSAAPTDTATRQALDQQLSALEAAYATLVAFSSNASANVLTVIEPAVPPDGPSSPRVLVDTVLGAGLTLFIALGLLLLREQLDSTVRSAAEAGSG
jgi:capsular polysaccharide biosynthesis protein